jgi:hypothetical protein
LQITRTTPRLRITRHDSQNRFTEGLTFITTNNLYLNSQTFAPPDVTSFSEALAIRGNVPILGQIAQANGHPQKRMKSLAQIAPPARS